MDQAAELRVVKNLEGEFNKSSSGKWLRDHKCGQRDKKDVRVIAITSGKGGVGKTHITTNLAYILSVLKNDILIFDADMGLANIDTMLGLAPKYNISHVLRGEKKLSDVIVSGPGGIRILPASSGIQEMSELSKGQKLTLLDELNELQESFDFMLIDTAAGITGNVLYFNMAAKEIIVVASPEPTSLTDAYALIKLLYRAHKEKRIMIIVNMVKSYQEAKVVFTKLSKATEHFLDLKIEYLGCILHDENITEAICNQKMFTEMFPHSRATKCLFSIARKIHSEKPDRHNVGSLKFFSRAILNADHGQ